MKHITKLFKNRFISATFWMFVATGISNVGNYLYHLLMIVMISSPKVFGELESAIALLYILYVPLMTLSLVIIKFVSSAKGKGDDVAVASLYHYFNKRLLIGGTVFTLLIILLSPLISSFLHFSSLMMVVLLALTFMTSMLSTFTRSILQGLTNFFSLSAISLVEVVAKIVLSVVLIYLGYKALGGLGAFVVSGLVGYLVGYFFVRKAKLKNSNEKIDPKPFITYAIPAFFTTFASISFITSDILIVRHFFPGVESGYYSFLSLLGKIIYFAASPIITAMFPLVSEHHAKGERYTHFLYYSLGITFIFIVPLVSLYYLFPQIVINLFPNKNYGSIAPLLGPMSVFFSLYALNAVLTSFYLSIHKILPTVLNVAGAASQILFLYLYHQSLSQMIFVSTSTSFVLLICLLLYYPYARR